MSNTMEIHGYTGEVTYRVNDGWKATLVRTAQYHTEAEVIEAINKSIYCICSHIIEDDDFEEPEDFDISEYCDSSWGVEDAYKDEQPGVVTLVNEVKDWIKSGFDGECPYNPAFDGTIEQTVTFTDRDYILQQIN